MMLSTSSRDLRGPNGTQRGQAAFPVGLTVWVAFQTQGKSPDQLHRLPASIRPFDTPSDTLRKLKLLVGEMETPTKP